VAGGSAAVAPPDGAVIEEGSASVSADPAGTPVTDISGGDAPEVPAVDYTNGSRLTWVVDGTRVEILSNLSVDELMKIAEGLVLSH
jgi:hypothetical protein